jgi:hypothetical protein
LPRAVYGRRHGQEADARKPPVRKKRKVKSNVGKSEWAFPKIQAMLDAIDEMAPDEKGVIFSQWTYVLMYAFPLIYAYISNGSSHGIVLFTALT